MTAVEAKPKTLMEALLAFQSKVPALQKDASNPHFKNKYVSLDAITQTVTPILNECGLVWLTMPCREDESGEPGLEYQLTHVGSGEQVAGRMPLILSKNDMQGLGSAYSYARRYAVSAVLGLSAEDDDGNKAATRPVAQQPAQNGSPPRLLTDEQRQKVVAAITDKGQTIELILAAVGAESTDDLTVEDARKIAALLERAA